MSSFSGIHPQDLNLRINTIVGVKKYQEVKKVMEAFDDKLRREVEQPELRTVDVKIR